MYWPDDDAWYVGKVGSFNSATNLYTIVYEDGYTEYVDLSKEQVSQWSLIVVGCSFLFLATSFLFYLFRIVPIPGQTRPMCARLELCEYWAKEIFSADVRRERLIKWLLTA